MVLWKIDADSLQSVCVFVYYVIICKTGELVKTAALHHTN